jgi:hypothetical protein
MRPDYVEQEFRFPLTFLNPPPGQYPNHLAAPIDASGVPDGHMTATFRLENLPFSQQRVATFSQTFALARPQLPVLAALLTEADRPGIERQRVCPVTQAKLGSMGPPVKLLVGGQPVYLCCQGCVAKVQQNPQFYLPASSATPPTPFVGQPQPDAQRGR